MHVLTLSALGLLQSAVGYVVAHEGEAHIVRGSAELDIGAETPLEEGDRIVTGKGKVELDLADKSRIAVGPGSRFVIRKYRSAQKRKGHIELITGQVWARFVSWGKARSRIKMGFPNAVAGIRGTTVWGHVAFDTFCTLEGNTRLKTRSRGRGNEKHLLRGGECVERLGNDPRPLKPAAKDVAKYVAGTRLRDD